MKKFVRLLSLVLVLLLAVSVFVACNDTPGDGPHTHDYGKWETKTEPTCTEDGVKERSCSCGEKETGAIDATGHTFGEWVIVKEATETESGSKERTCSVCTEKETATIAPTNCVFGEWVVDTVAGTRSRVCTDCGYVQTEELSNGPFTITIQFIDPVTGDRLQQDIERTNKNYVLGFDCSSVLPRTLVNNVSSFADYILIGWDTTGDNTPDEGYKSLTGDIVINAVFRAKKMLTVKFYDTADHCTEIQVKEGDAIDTSTVTITPRVGYVFKSWQKADESNLTSLSKAVTDASFVAEYAKIDSVIPLISKNTITIDGKKDEEAWKNATYLPINEEKYADLETGIDSAQLPVRPAEKDGKIPATGKDSSWITADAWLLWDGEYIYMMVEVSDKTLTYRNPYYLSLNNNPWLNDTVEAYFNFEQTSTATQNKNKVAMDALGQKLFSNSIAVYGQRSTNFDDMEGAARSALGYFNGGAAPVNPDATLTGDQTVLEGTDDDRVQYAGYNGTKSYSYRIEFKFVAKTEGVPDKNYDVDDNGRLATGTVLPNGDVVPELKTDADKQDPNKTKKEYYKFTEGKMLTAGCFVRFNLQITDLMVSRDDLEDEKSGFYEGQPGSIEQMKLGSVFDKDGNAFFPPYVPCGHTQYDLSRYVSFSLGGEGSVAKWEVYELKGSTKDTAKMYDADGNEVVQGATTETVTIAK